MNSIYDHTNDAFPCNGESEGPLNDIRVLQDQSETIEPEFTRENPNEFALLGSGRDHVDVDLFGMFLKNGIRDLSS